MYHVQQHVPFDVHMHTYIYIYQVIINGCEWSQAKINYLANVFTGGWIQNLLIGAGHIF